MENSGVKYIPPTMKNRARGIPPTIQQNRAAWLRKRVTDLMGRWHWGYHGKIKHWWLYYPGERLFITQSRWSIK